MTQEKASFEDDPLYESFFKAFESHLFNPLHNRDEDAFGFLLVNPQDIRLNHGELQAMFRHCYETEFPSDPELIRVLLKVLGIEPGSRPPSPSADPWGQILHTVSLEQIEQHILDSFKAAVLEVQVSHQGEGRMRPIEVGPSEEESTPDLDKKAEGGEKYTPTKYGGKELCIAVYNHKDRFRDLRRVALGMRNKANIRYSRHGYPDPLAWYQGNPKGFTQYLWKLRERARDKDWYDSIPSNYYRTYVG